MLWLYRLLFLPALLFMAPTYVRRMWRRGGYRGGFTQRLGGHPRLAALRAGRHRVWLQAVSVGEMLAIGPLLQALRGDDVEVYLTTTTSTGFRIANDRYLGLVGGVGYFPLDWWLFSARAWRRIAPTLAIITEGERWPEHLRQARGRGVPVLCINARLSDRSYERMMLFPPAVRFIWRDITRLLPASTLDAERFAALGVPAEKIVPTGNLKLDVRIPPLAEADRARLRRELGLPAGLVLLGASTWPGEGEALLEALRRTRAAGRPAGGRCSLLIVPRHAERRGDLERLLQKQGWNYHLRSRGPFRAEGAPGTAAAGEVDVAVGDTTGELRHFTQLADLVFVGKSLPPHTEGQTPVEAAALGKPILFGPGMGNFRTIAQDLIERGAARQVRDAAELAEAATELLGDAVQRSRLAAAAAEWHRENAGAVERTLAAIRAELEKL